MITGYHAIYENDYFEAIDNAKKYGFDFVQYDLGVPHFFLDKLTNSELTDIRKYASSKGVTITFHMPGDNVSLFCDYPLIRKGILDQFKKTLEKANLIGARHVTIHAGNYPRFKKSGSKLDDFSASYQTYYENVLYENIKDLINNSGNVLICLENYLFNSVIMNVAERLINEKYALYLTLDIPKIYNKNKIDEAIFNFMTANIESVREIHIHDMNEAFGSHQIVGTGTIDFSIYKEFIQKDNVFLNFEVRPIEAAYTSKMRLLSNLELE